MYGDEQVISTLINNGVDMDAVIYEVCICIAICRATTAQPEMKDRGHEKTP